MKNTLTLYSGPHCHLCDQAKQIIYPLLHEAGWKLHEVNISESESLKEKYGLRIPVIMTPDGQEKGWPFTAGQVKRLIKPD